MIRNNKSEVTNVPKIMFVINLQNNSTDKSRNKIIQ